jgi:hypothetical protein
MNPTNPTRRLAGTGATMALLALLGGALPARAQFPQHIVNDDPASGEENRFDPAIVGLDDGGFLLFWIDFDRAQRDILVRRFDAELRPLALPDMVNDDGGIRDQFGVVTSPARGGRAVAAWLDEREAVIGVYAQVYRTDSGRPLGTNLLLTADRAAQRRSAPAAATSADGTSIVCWEEANFGGARIRARLIGAEANLPGAPIEIAPENPDWSQRAPAVAALPDGRWVVAWHETDGFTYLVRTRLLAADGSPLGSPSLAHSEPLLDAIHGPEPAILVQAQDIILAWVDNLGRNCDLYGRRLDLEGNFISERTLLRAVSDSPRDDLPGLHGAPDGRFVLTWYGSEINRALPRFRLFDTDGRAASGDLVLSDEGYGVSPRPGTALALPGNAWLLTWSDDRLSSLQVYMRKVAADGSSAGPPTRAWSVPASSSQLLSDVALLPNHRAVVAWGDLRNGNFSLFARFLSDSGVPERAPSFAVSTKPVTGHFFGPPDVDTFLPHRPSIASSATGSFVVTWAATPRAGAKLILAQLYDPDGQGVGGNFTVVDPQSERDAQSTPRAAMAPDGSFVIAWHNNKSDAAGDDILIQRFNAVGEKVGVPFSPVDAVGNPFDQVTPAIAVSPFGDIVVTWVDHRRESTWDIVRAWLYPDGTPIEPTNRQVSPEGQPGNDQVNPSVAANGTAIVTVWENRPPITGLIQGKLEVLETRASAGPGNGARDAGPVRVAVPVLDFTVNPLDHPPGAKYPRVVMDVTGRFAVTWCDERDGQRRIWARRYAADGTPVGEPYSIIGGETRENRVLAVAAADSTWIQYAWTDSRRGRGWDIYARRVDWAYSGESTPVRLESWNASSLAEGLEIRWEVPLGTTGALFRAWRDPAAGPRDLVPTPEAALVSPEWIAASSEGMVATLDREAPRGAPVRYFLEISANGARGEFIGPVEARWDPPPLAWRASPNPSRGLLRLAPPVPGPARAEIFEPGGRSVRVLERRDGDAPIEWDGLDARGRAIPSGIYFARATAGQVPATTLRLVRLR